MIKKIGLLFFGTLFIVGATGSYALADTSRNLRISYDDIGLLQLAAHDFFRVDRTLEQNLENGKLDLSTIFDHGAGAIPTGGEIRNSENILVFTVSKRFVDQYVQLTSLGLAPEKARLMTVLKFKQELNGAYMRLLGEGLPMPQKGEVTMTEDLAFRIVHDLLPGTVIQNGVKKSIFDPSLSGQTLSKTDMQRMGAPLDGQFDQAFRAIQFGPFVLDLLERDSSFAQQFNTDYSFEHFLGEASDGRLSKNEKVTGYIRTLFAKGLAN